MLLRLLSLLAVAVAATFVVSVSVWSRSAAFFLFVWAGVLTAVGAASLDALIDETIPASIRLKRPLDLPPAEGWTTNLGSAPAPTVAYCASLRALAAAAGAEAVLAAIGAEELDA